MAAGVDAGEDWSLFGTTLDLLNLLHRFLFLLSVRKPDVTSTKRLSHTFSH